MRQRHLRWLLPAAAAAGLFLAAGVSLRGQASDLPPASQIVQKFVNLIGGEAEYRKLSSIHATGAFELTAQNTSGTVEMISARPAKMIVRGELPGVGKFETGYDGKIGWEIDPLSGPKLLTGRRLTEVSDDAWFDGVLHRPDHVKSMTTIAKTTFDNRPAYQVKVVFNSGTEEDEYFDADTSLLLGSEASREIPMGILPVTGFMRDYKKFGAVMQATTIASRTMGLEQVLRLTSFEFNKLPPTAFDLPPQIKALIAK